MGNEHRLDAVKILMQHDLLTKDEAIRQIANTAGRTALEEDLAAFPEKVEQYYNAAQRDRLIANTRQDVAEIVALVPSLLSIAVQTRGAVIRMQKIIYLLATVNIASFLVIAWMAMT